MIVLPGIDELLHVCRLERSIHPQAQWVDYYKICLQSCYGAGHSNPDSIQAKQFIDTELNDMDREYLPLIQPLRQNAEIIRISLSVLDPIVQERLPISGYIDGTILADAFCNSAKQNPVDIAAWLRLWRRIKPYLHDMIDTTTYETGSLDTMLNSRQIPSHSTHFKTQYDPHYRVINTDTIKDGSKWINKLITTEFDQ